MKKYKILLASFVLFAVFAFASQSKAALNVDELRAMISQLQSQISSLQEKLAEAKKEPVQNICKLNLNLKLGDKGSDVEALQEALEKEGFSVGEEKTTKYFGNLTRLAVINFQEKYKDDILTPLGLKNGTGFFRESTRLKLKGIYCQPSLEENLFVDVSFSYPLYSVLENEPYAVITVNLSAPGDKDISVEYETFGGTATPGVDYYPGKGVLNFVSGQTSKTFQINIIDDNIIETDETVKIRLFNSKNARIGEQAEAELAIIDDDHSEPSVFFNPVFYSVKENSGSLVVNVSLSKKTPDTVTVNYFTSDFTAKAGSDYEPLSGTLTFLPNETSKNITVTIIDDSVYEGNESFHLTLKNPNKARLGLRFKSTITINDDEQAPPNLPTVYFSPIIYSESENVGTLNLKVYLSKPSNDTVRVDYFTSDFTAKAGSDYEPLSGTLTFLPKETSKNISITIINDNEHESLESFNAVLKNAVNANLSLGTKIATILIIDDDQAPPSGPTIYFSPVVYSVEEGHTVSLNVYLSKASNNNVSVSYYTSEHKEGEGLGSKATAGSDYEPLSGTLNFVPGEIFKTISIKTIDDDIYEGNEIFSVTLKDVIGADLGVRYKAVVIIKDNDPAPPKFPTINFDPLFYSVNENSGSVILYVSLSSASANTVNVEYQSSDFTAKAGSDYQATNETLTFTPGQISKTIPVVIINDDIYELTEMFNVTLKNPVNAEIKTLTKTAAITIKDDDQALPKVTFNQALYYVNENAGNVVLQVSLDKASGNIVNVGYQSSDFTAKAGSDYQAVNGTLTFTPGQTSKTISVTIINDNIKELSELFYVTLKNPSSGLELGIPKTASVTILDDDQALPLISFSPVFYSVNENSGSVILYVALSKSSNSTITVNYLTSDLTANAGSDYQATNEILTFTPGQTLKTIPVVILDDTISEQTESFSVKLENPVNANLNALAKTAIVTINDDDSGEGEFGELQKQQQQMQ